MLTAYWRLGILLTSAGAIWANAPQALAAGSLLKSTAATEPLAVERRFKSDKTLKRKRLVDIDISVLEQEILPPGLDRAANRAAVSAALGGGVTLNLFSDLSVTLAVTRVEPAVGGGVVWSAETAEGYGILVVNGQKVTGSIETDGRTILIEPANGSGHHRIREIDTEAYPNDAHLEIARAAKTGKGGGKGGGGSSGGGTTTTPPPPGTILEVNLLAAYTALAFTELGGVPADKAALDVAIANQGYVNSGVPLHLNLVGVTAVSTGYDEQSFSNQYQPLYDLTSGTGYNFPAIRSQRDTLSADLLTMYADRPEYCGVAWVGGSPPSAGSAFSVVNPYCSGTATLAHELGHNMGLRHDRYVEAPASADVYNFGFVSTAGKFRDIMSYNNQCADLGFSCKRITYFSNPGLLYNGYVLGIPQGTTGAADATRKLGENATAISNFR